MKKTIFILMLVLMAGVVVAYNPIIVTRTSPSEVNSNSDFTVTYNFDINGNDRMSVMFTEIVEGGCQPANKDIYVADTWNAIEERTFTAPSSGTCTFKGYYEYGDGVNPFYKITPSVLTVIVSGICQDTCDSKGYDCGTVCGINCGNCNTGYTCQNGKCVSEFQCGNGICESGETTTNCQQDCKQETCKEKLDCEFYEECNKEETKCKIAVWVWIVLIFIFLFMILRR